MLLLKGFLAAELKIKVHMEEIEMSKEKAMVGEEGIFDAGNGFCEKGVYGGYGAGDYGIGIWPRKEEGGWRIGSDREEEGPAQGYADYAAGLSVREEYVWALHCVSAVCERVPERCAASVG